jgi:hypothetical protein
LFNAVPIRKIAHQIVIFRMPRKPAVPHHEMVNAIILAKGGIVDGENRISGPTAEIWRQLASNLGNRVQPRYLYQYVKQDRHDVHRLLGLTQSRSTSSPVYSTSPVSQMDMELDTDEEVERELQPEKKIMITFTPAEWHTIQPREMTYKRRDRVGTRVRMVLPQQCWTNALIEKLWECHKLPCPYSIIRGQVTCGEDTEFIKIAALCKECGASATGVVLFKPLEGESVSLTWRAPDTRKVPHSRSRWLTGATRQQVGKELRRNCASAYRRELAFLKMDQGDLKPPTLWSNSVLRKAKQDYKEQELGTKGHGSPINSLVILKYSAKYAGTIHDIGIDKFFVHYYTAAQLLLYKKHTKTNYSKLSLDATGTLVKKIYRTEEQKSGHIFLYEGVLTSVGRSGPPQHIPVVQMLSEKHDTNSIIYWLNEWRRAGAPVPNEVVVDNSAALKSAVARVFASMDIKTYIDNCFAYLREGRGNLPKTYIRLDVAHYINAVCRWRIWADPSKKRVKEFYVRCLGVLINAQTFQEFEDRLRNVLTVAMSPCQSDGHGEYFPMHDCLARLTRAMKNGLDELNVVNIEKAAPLPDNGEMESSFLSQWITEMENSITPSDDPQGELNPYYLPEVAKEFCRMAKEFVLWSSVLTSDFGSPFIRGTSNPVESTFSDLKCNVLKGEAKPQKVDNFVAIHINAIEGACRIADVTTFDGININGPKNKMDHDEDSGMDLNHIENWRGLGAPKRSKYLTAFPGAEIAVASTNFKSHGVLRNGSGKAVVTSDGTVLIISNTCPFDALCHLVTNAYMTFESYRDQMAKSVNQFIVTAMTLAREGTKKETYSKRAEALASVLDPKSALQMPTTRRRTLALEYDAFGNVTNLLKKLIPPHTSQEVMCEVENHQIQKYVIDPDSRTLVDLGLEELEQSLTANRHQCGQCFVRYGGHIFVDVEFLSDTSFPRDDPTTARLYSLSEVPQRLSLGNDTFYLSGVVSYANNHYVAYCFNTKWRKYDDLVPKEHLVEDVTKIWPSVLMYVKSANTI